MARVNTTYKIGDKDLKLEYREVDPMVFISGGDENPRYVSIIRFDANDASKYFANTLSWSEYLDKSFYLDYWIKKSLRDTVKEFISKNEKMTKRFIAGIQYLGGDEGLLISPSLISINFMIDMIDKVYEKTKVTFKVGIVTVKPDHPIQFAIQATEKIMEEAKIENKNSLGIIVSPSFISPSVIQGITEDEKKVLKLKNSFEDVKNIINMVNPDISESEKDKERVKDFLREINDIVDFYYTHSFYETLVYIIRERA
ncbi:MAG: hypothetical protein K1T65_10235, partial [Candidatus Aramenus sp.]|nr:hypothetical protein [Candidatus Aramenus sp.]